MKIPSVIVSALLLLPPVASALESAVASSATTESADATPQKAPILIGHKGGLSGGDVMDHPNGAKALSATDLKAGVTSGSRLTTTVAASSTSTSSVDMEVGVDGDTAVVVPHGDSTTKATTSSKVPKSELECIDSQPQCQEWAAAGECSANPVYLSENCPHACGICSQMKDTERHLGLKQEVAGDLEIMSKTMDILYKARQYVASVDRQHLNNCFYRNKLCGFWAATGECESNPDHLRLWCAPACGSCEEISHLNWAGKDDLVKVDNTNQAKKKKSAGEIRLTSHNTASH